MKIKNTKGTEVVTKVPEEIKEMSEEGVCNLCGKPYDSEYHLSDECQGGDI